jgi:hypothetical protein
MPSPTIYRLTGLALLIAFPLQLVGFAIHPPGLESLAIFVLPQYGPAHMVLAVSWTFALLGFPGLYLAQAARAGVTGLVGIVASALMALLTFELVMFEAVAAPILASDAATSRLVAPDGALVNGELGMIGRFFILSIVTLGGPVLLGVASLRARVLPRASALLQIASVVGLPLFVGLSLLSNALGIPGALLQFPGLGYAVLFLGYAIAGWTLWRVPTDALFPSWTKAPRAARG